MNWLEGLPLWFKTRAVIFGLMGLGATVGKAAADYTGHAAIMAEAKASHTEESKLVCLQVAQLSHTDWTHCVAPVEISNAH